ncbi:MAG TPA: hypothetical protein VLV17_05220, partial [Anaeromyxobacteraceae bacterium]|nr:hypothetical protein [Anaeromyxobacteraceae bacterium]
MRLRPSALALLALFAACGGGDGGSTDGGSNVCNPTDGGALSCATSPAQSSTAAPTSILFHGEVAVGGSATFKVPLNTASLTVIEQAVDAPDSIVASGATIDNVAVPRLVEVKDASGVTHTLYDDSKDDGAFSGTTTDPTQIEQLPAFFFSDSPSTGTLTLPNTTGGLALVGPQGLPAGQATVVVSDYAYACSSIAGCCGGSNTSTYDVTVIAKPLVSGAIPSQGTLDLNLYFVANKACVPGNTSSCPALSEASAPSDTDLQRMLSTLS